jgi:uncharacterized membrane protein
MLRPPGILLRNSRQLTLLASLGLASLVSLGLLGLRMLHAGNSRYFWLVWNLFLAWLPACSALVAYNLHKDHSKLRGLLVLICAIGWFLFFPNAPYLITDLIHLHARADAPFWFDLVLLIAFAWTGFFLGLVSLLLMQEIVRRIFGAAVSWCFAFAMLGLGSFGIYLGRFLRWNSWDVVTDPLKLFVDIAHQVRHPFMHAQTVAFSALFGFFLVAMYLTMMALMNFHQEVRDVRSTST